MVRIAGLSSYSPESPWRMRREPPAGRELLKVPFLRSVSVDRSGVRPDVFPWNVAAVRAMDTLDLSAPMTFLAGENGSGKSTVLEAIAEACGCPADGGPSNVWLTGRSGDDLAGRTRPVFTSKPVGGAWFLRAESFTRVAERVEDAMDYASLQLRAAYGDRTPQTLSHGQSFMELLATRLLARCLWFMDEPEAPLSFRNQLATLRLLREVVDAGSQVLVATHSPVLLAMPDAVVYELDDHGARRCRWDELELVQDVKAFLDMPERTFRHLFE